MSKTLSLKQKRFVKEYIKSGNQTQSVIKAGFKVKNQNTAGVMGNEYLRKPKIKRAIEKELKKQGLNEGFLAEQLKLVSTEGLEDKKKITPDHALKALDMAAKLLNLYPDKKTSIEKKSLTLHYDAKAPDQILKKMSELNKKLEDYTKVINPKEVVK